MTHADEHEPEGSSERFRAVPGRSSGPFVMVPLWIMLNASAKARALYEALAAHRDWWATGYLVQDAEMAVLADLIDVKDRKSVRRYLQELDKLGAITIERGETDGGMKGANVYVIHDVPPKGFAGPRTLREYYARRRKTAGQPDGASTPHRSKQGKHPAPPPRETGKSGEIHVVAGRSDGVSTPHAWGPDAPSDGVSTPHPPYKKGVRKNPPSRPPSHTGSASAGAGQGEGEGSPEGTASPLAGSESAVPSPRAAADDGRAAGAVDGQALEDERLTAARLLLEGLPAPVTPGARTVRDLTPAVAAALASGWTRETLTARLTVDLPATVHSERALLTHRLEDLPPVPPAASAGPVYGPRCDDARHDPRAPESDRFLYGDDDTVIGMCECARPIAAAR